MIDEISATELKKRLDAGDDIILLDVRESHELDICSLNYTVHIPMGELTFKVNSLDQFKDKDIAVYCRSGVRSERAAMFLKDSGFKTVYNLRGGILAWADEVDPKIQKY
jgi:sulfur-carrier protein adenylyltransferase/sulfurtransferase